MDFSERRKKVKRDAWIFRIMTIAGGILLMSLAIWAGQMRWGQDIWENLYMESISIVLTILIIDVLNRWRDERNAEESLLQQLELSIHSKVESVATRAMEDLITMGLVRGQDSIFTKQKGYDLSDIRLSQLDLRGVNFSTCNLTKSHILDADLSTHADKTVSDLSHAKCEQMVLTGSSLSGADLRGADFKNARLIAANLSNTRLDNTDFRGANLSQVCFIGANLDKAILDETTILPDAMQMLGEYEQTYVPGIDLSIYTDSSHEDAFQAAGCRD